MSSPRKRKRHSSSEPLLKASSSSVALGSASSSSSSSSSTSAVVVVSLGSWRSKTSAVFALMRCSDDLSDGSEVMGLLTTYAGLVQLNFQTPNGVTLAMSLAGNVRASIGSKCKMLHRLASFGLSNLNAIDVQDFTAITYSIAYADFAFTCALMDLGANPKIGRCPLSQVCAGGGRRLAASGPLGEADVAQYTELFLRRGVVVNPTSRPLVSALSAALAHGYWSSALQLLRVGADVSASGRPSGLTPLQHALCCRTQLPMSILVELVLRGSDLTARHPTTGNTPLHSLCRFREYVGRALTDSPNPLLDICYNTAGKNPAQYLSYEFDSRSRYQLEFLYDNILIVWRVALAECHWMPTCVQTIVKTFLHHIPF